jgi:hypothetical protein
LQEKFAAARRLLLIGSISSIPRLQDGLLNGCGAGSEKANQRPRRLQWCRLSRTRAVASLGRIAANKTGVLCATIAKGLQRIKMTAPRKDL